MPSAYRNRASVVRLLFSSAATRLAALLSPMRSSAASFGHAELVQVGKRADDAAVDQLIDQLVAQAFDVHRPAAGEMQHRLLALRRAEQAAAAAPVGLAFLAHDRAAAHRALALEHLRRSNDAPASAGRRSATTPTTSGITSPARRTITVSPMRTSLRRGSSSLCSVALLTVVPPTNTGSSLATGVSLPVRPTWISMPSTRVICSCAGYLCATAQRGSRVTKPRRSLQRAAVDLVDHAVDVERQRVALGGDRGDGTPPAPRRPRPPRARRSPAGRTPSARRAASLCVARHVPALHVARP